MWTKAPQGLLVALTIAACSHVTVRAQENPLIGKADAFVTHLAMADYAAAVATFDSTMTAVVPLDRLQGIWSQIENANGEWKRILRTRKTALAGYEVVFVTCAFANRDLDVKVVYNRRGLVSGLFFVAPTEPYQPPIYADTTRFVERAVVVGKAPWTLPATLCVPTDFIDPRTVILVHGSGPNDRDETIGPNRVFRDLAWGLASRGIAVLRYDKRTFVYPGKLGSMAGLTVREETMDDVKAAVASLRAIDDFNPGHIFILGHSLGAMLVPRLAPENQDVAGFIALAAPARPLVELMLLQFRYLFSLDDSLSAEESAKLNQIEEEVTRVSQLRADADSSLWILGAPAAYWLDLRGYDPVKTALSQSKPLFLAFAGRDYQVPEAEAEIWRQHVSGRRGVTFRKYPALNHLFIAGQGRSTPQEYEIPGHVAKALIDDLAQWIVEQ